MPVLGMAAPAVSTDSRPADRTSAVVENSGHWVAEEQPEAMIGAVAFAGGHRAADQQARTLVPTTRSA